MVADKGFDITDESFYLLSAQYPMDVLAGFTSFGYYTGVLLRLAQGDVANFRLYGFVFLLATGTLFSYAAVNTFNRQMGVTDSTLTILSRICAIVVGVFLYHSWGLPTPSYNLLVLSALLLSAGAFLLGLAGLTSGSASRTVINGWFASTGVGLVLVASGKLTSAMVAAVIFIITGLAWPCTDHRRRWTAAGAVLAGIVVLISVHLLAFQDATQYRTVLANGLIALESNQGGYETGPMIAGYIGELQSLPGAIISRYSWWYLLLPATILMIGKTFSSSSVRKLAARLPY